MAERPSFLARWASPITFRIDGLSAITSIFRPFRAGFTPKKKPLEGAALNIIIDDY